MTHILLLATCDSQLTHLVKFGYPPKALPEVDGPLSAIPITRGEQIIVTSVPAPLLTALPRQRLVETPPAPSVKALNDSLSGPVPLRPDSPLAENDIPTESAESVPLPGRDAGFLQLRVVPDDNSCLFSAVGIVFEGDITAAPRLRKGDFRCALER